MKNPICAPLLALGAGIVISRVVSFTIHDFLWTLPPLACLTFLTWSFRSRTLPLCAVLTLLLCGALLETLHRPGPPPEVDAGAHENVILDGCVVSPPAFFEGRDQFLLELAPGARARVNLSLKDGETPPDLRYGQMVELQARMRRIRNFQNPGAFDYEGFSARSHVYWTAFASTGSPVTVKPGRCGSRFQAAVFALRVAALDRIDRLYPNNPYATAMMEATLIGESTRMERIWTDTFRRTGTYHMLVIDGLHITVLAAFLLLLLRLCFIPEMTALAITASGAWLYALVSGMNAPSIRAAAGFTLYVVARYFYRRGRLMNLLAAIAIAYLVGDPSQLFEAGFQLSFLAVAAIGLLAAPVLKATSLPYARAIAGINEPSRDPRLAPRAAQFRLELRLLATTLVTTLQSRGPGPLAPSRSPNASLSSATTSPSSPPPSRSVSPCPWPSTSIASRSRASRRTFWWSAARAGGPSGLLRRLHHVASSGDRGGLAPAGRRSGGWLAHPSRTRLAGARSSAVAGRSLLRGAAAAGPGDPKIPPVVLGRANRRPGPFRADLLASLPACAAPWRTRTHGHRRGTGRHFTGLLSDSKLLLIDGGGVLSFGPHRVSRIDIGEDVVSPYLWSRSIRKIDVVALTHAHDDHAGGLPAVIANFHPAQLWTGAMAPSAAWSAVHQKALAENVQIRELAAGRSFNFGGARIEVISPPAGYRPGASPTNNDSLALRVTFGQRSLLLTGDMEKPMERSALARAEPLRADILKVGHHGSNTSSIDSFLDAVSPEFAVISDGFENTFRHPHPKVLERLAAHDARILRTDQDGLITLRTDGRRISVETFRLERASEQMYLLPSTWLPLF